MPEEEIKTPYMELPKFDYNKLQMETTMEAIKQIYKIWADNADLLVFDHEATKDLIEKNQGIVSQKMMEALITNKVPEVDMKFITECFQTTIYMLFTIISRQKTELEKEFLARSLGVRDPGTDKFTKEYSTIGDLFTSLEKIRNEQDKESNQYFIVKSEK